MKQLLFLLLFPCLALAQYTGNAGQKITLGEQTSADGLVFRGVASIDTVTATSKITRANKQDTSAFLLLDTVTNLLWHYKTGSNGWIQAGGGVSVSSFSAGTTGLTPSTATTGAVTLGGTLSVANGGTGSATQNFVDLTTAQTVAGDKTFSSGVIKISNSNNKFIVQNTGATTGYAGMLFTNTGGTILFTQANSAGASWANGIADIPYSANFGSTSATPLILATNHTGQMIITSAGLFGLGEAVPTEKLHVVGNARITAVGAGAYANDLNITSTGVLTTASSDEKYKYNILPITYGLNTILQLNPVNFQWIEGEENDLGFIAQDVAEIIPEAVNTNWNSDLLMRYESIIPILTKAIQEQNALIKALEQRILTLENK